MRVELEHQGEIIEVELTRERAAGLDLTVGQTVWLKPRQAKVFAPESVAAAGGAVGKQPFLF